METPQAETKPNEIPFSWQVIPELPQVLNNNYSIGFKFKLVFMNTNRNSF